MRLTARGMFALAALAAVPAAGCGAGFEEKSSDGGAGGTASGGEGGMATTATAGSGGTPVGGGGAGGTAELGTAVQFDGIDDYMAVPMTDALMHATGFSWELWFRPESAPTSSAIARSQTLMGAMDDQGCEDVYVGFGSEFSEARELTFLLDGRGGCGVRDVDPARFRPDDGFENGRYYHVVAVADFLGMVSRLYVDGVERDVKARAVNPINRAVVVNIARWHDGTSTLAHFTGRIDELRIYNRVLVADEVSARYARGKGVYGEATDEDVVSAWHFDEGMGEAAVDYRGALNGILTNGASWAPGIVALP